MRNEAISRPASNKSRERIRSRLQRSPGIDPLRRPHKGHTCCRRKIAERARKRLQTVKHTWWYRVRSCYGGEPTAGLCHDSTGVTVITYRVARRNKPLRKLTNRIKSS